MLSISATDDWRTGHPGAFIGLLELSGILGTGSSVGTGSFGTGSSVGTFGSETSSTRPLDDRKREIETRLRSQFQGFTRQDLLLLPVLSAYDRYYRRFDKTYHVQLQVESIVMKGKDLPDVTPLVDANFMAEVETFVLTAGHDAGRLRSPLRIDSSREGDQQYQMNGALKPIRPGDMVMRDAEGIRCSILYGQDHLSAISAATSHVLYVAYAPAGVPAEVVEAQLRKIEENVRLFSPLAVVEQRRLLSA